MISSLNKSSSACESVKYLTLLKYLRFLYLFTFHGVIYKNMLPNNGFHCSYFVKTSKLDRIQYAQAKIRLMIFAILIFQHVQRLSLTLVDQHTNSTVENLPGKEQRYYLFLCYITAMVVIGHYTYILLEIVCPFNNSQTKFPGRVYTFSS